MASYTYFAVELGDEHALGCKCCRFSSGTDLPVPKKLTDDELADLARKFSHRVLTNWARLNAILKRYEDAVQRRWMKKNGKQRRCILLEAWPDMAPTHRPDFAGFRKAFKNHPRSRTMQSKSYLWPYINLEDLMQRHLLLLFINSRGRNLPDQFISTDIEAAHLGKGWAFKDDDTEGAAVAYDSEEHKDGITVMSLHGERTPKTYGKLILKKGAAPLTKSSLKHHPSLGLLGLEIQQGIYTFLLDCVKLILHDIEPSQFFLAPQKPEPVIPHQEPNGYQLFLAHTLEAPYQVPQLLDLDRIKDLVSARRSAAEDHLWLLRDDPGYFVDTLRDWKEHDNVTLKHCCTRCYHVVAAKMISDASTYFFFWDHISKRLNRLPPLKNQVKRADPASLRLAPAEESIWAEILEVVDYLIYEPIAALRIGIPASPRLRHCFDLPKKAQPGNESNYSWEIKAKISDAERRVTGLIFAIVNSEQRQLHSLNHIIQEFQYMMETDSASADLIDPWINSQIADLALLSEIKLRIEGLQPWHSSWKAQGIHQTGVVKRCVDTLIRIVVLNVRDCMSYLCTEFSFELLVDPFDGRLDYPITKAHTKANVDQLRRAEKTLEKFWKELDEDLKDATGYSIATLMKPCMTAREKHRTPIWKEPRKLNYSKAKTVITELSTNNTLAYANLPSQAESFKSTPKTKTKTKTRGVPSSPASAATPPATPPIAHEDLPATAPAPTIEVSKRSFRALDALMPAPTSMSHQRYEIAWNELLSVMDEIGFQAEKLYGSVWMFKPREEGKCKVDVSRSISFHEPKEVRKGHKIPTNMVRTFGRRLKHAYGWVDGMFVCEAKKA